MLSRAFASASSPSLVAGGDALGRADLTHSLSSTQLLSDSNDDDLVDQYDVQDDTIQGTNVELGNRTGSDDFLDVFGAEGDMEGLAAPFRSAVALADMSDAQRPSYQFRFAAPAAERNKPPLCPTSSADSSNCFSTSVAIPQRQNSNPFMQMARSCPKPIAMPRKGRRGSLPSDHDDLSVFVPPHELAASSLMDPSCVAESLSRKGTAALRLRSAALRKTGFYEGHTETMRVSSSFKP